ncbi:gamma-glutamyltransferase family protein [Azospirillum halopraeferens]|uniref:gamma-glutamyltransferase family protein n=1 Tax=Azospirillum halopraeferens TaxID=34010 RepID=UPI00048ED298|nr:gamma-glutamyltransferase family protein [Azospirillum halopraeferens]
MRDFQRPGRSTAYAERGMVASSHPLATLTGLDVLRAGGNAMDAAIAAAAVLCVAEPHMTGIGGDVFALYAPAAGGVLALNGSGRAPQAATPERMAALGVGSIGPDSVHAVTVPGAVDAWCRLHGDHATLPLDLLLEPAAALAEDGCLVQPRVARDWAAGAARLSRLPATRALLLPGGRPPAEGDRFRNPALAATLRRIARHGRAGFYDGPVLDDLLTTLRASGGLHTTDDFAAQRCEYVTPIATTYNGFTVHECPPNGQGLAALMLLNTLAGTPADAPEASEADRVHWLAEATKLVYGERDALLGDPRFTLVPVDALLGSATAARLRARIAGDRSLPDPAPLCEPHRDTIYLCVVDRDRNAVSFINSLFDAFGSAIAAPQSGVLFHCRGRAFRTEPGHPNSIAPGKRPLHTIIPGMVTHNGRTIMPFGVMGGQYQAVGHAQFLMDTLGRGLDLQEAVDRPRSFVEDGVLRLETGHDPSLLPALRARGHRVERAAGPIGGAQAIRVDHDRGILIGASDPRKDGMALGW